MSAAAMAAVLLVAALWLPLVLPVGSMLAMLLVIGSAAVVAFVILRRGEGAALRAAGACVVLLVTLSFVLYGSVVQVPLVAMVFWLPAILAAVVLRRSVSLGLAVRVLVVCGAAIAVGVHLVQGEGDGFWREPLEAQLGAAGTGLEAAQIDALVVGLSNMMAGVMGVSVMSVALCSLFLARYWQASMVHPGGFREEFHTLSLGRGAVLACTVAIALAAVLEGRLWTALAIVAVFALFVQGLAVAHAVIAQRGLSRGWLIGLYVLLLLPHTLLLVAALGLADDVFRLRRPPKTPPPPPPSVPPPPPA